VPSLARGTIDVAVPAVGAALFNSIATGLPIKIVADYAYNEPGTIPGSVVVRKDLVDTGAFKSAADAKGRTVAISARGQYSDYAATQFLKLGKLTKKDVRIVNLSYPDMVTSLGTKAIDIALLTEPNATIAKDSAVGTIFMSNSEFDPSTNYAIVAYGERLAQKDKDLGLRFMQGYVQTILEYRKMKDNPAGRQALSGMFQKQLPLSDATVYDRVTLPSVHADPTVDRVHLAKQLEFYRADGLIRGLPNLESAVDDEFVRKALASSAAGKD
jgi:NitT/TauT family transport system substrate-binding protein